MTNDQFKGFMEEFNAKMLNHSIKLLTESEEVTSIYINYPALLLRKKCGLYPNGRTSHRFKNQLRRLVTVLDANKKVVGGPGYKKLQQVTDVDEAEKELPDAGDADDDV